MEENAKSQIQYLQSRIKEIVEETQQDSPTQVRYTEGKAGGGKPKKQGNQSLLATIRTELDSMCQEVMALREALRDEGNRGEALVN